MLSPARRSMFAVPDGTLRFVEAGNIPSNDTIFNVGYNYAVSKRNVIGVLYRFTAFRYLDNPQALNSHEVHAAFGRKITGRLALQLSVRARNHNFPRAHRNRDPAGHRLRWCGIELCLGNEQSFANLQPRLEQRQWPPGWLNHGSSANEYTE